MATKRFLQSPHLRNFLHDSAYGRCELCGITLPPDWHADHIEPWILTHRTNVLEMQALCPTCNEKKGDRMLETPFKSSLINLGPPMREGQRGAINAMWHNVRQGVQHTGIVLPTRYGKSDVIKMGGLGLLLDELASRVVVLAPATNLVEQILDKPMFDATAKRYGVPSVLGADLLTWGCYHTPRKPFPPDGKAKFLAMTIQMANSCRHFLAQWVEDERRKTGLPPVFFIDEVHMAAKSNQWGEAVHELEKAGAWLVLLTATPYRTDKAPIQGFRYKEVGKDYRETLRGTARFSVEEVKYVLDPDWETSYWEAWNEIPQALCYVSRIPIAPEMQRIDGRTAAPKGNTAPLSAIPATAARASLNDLVREDFVIRDGCQKLITELLNKRAIAPHTAAIAFVGNDTGDEDDDPDEERLANRHALMVEKILSEMWPNCRVVIATSTSGNDPRQRIKDFQNNVGDVLILKQMGGVGMDVPRAKVALDLSTFRTDVLFVQRLCRIATVWQYGESPTDLMLAATYIYPGDARGAELFDAWIAREGGDASTYTLEFLEDRIRQNGEVFPLPDTFVPTGRTTSDTMADTEQRAESTDALVVVGRLRTLFPEITTRRTEPETAEIIAVNGITFNADGTIEANPSPPPPAEQPEGELVIRNLNDEQESLRVDLEALVRKAVRKRIGNKTVTQDVRGNTFASVQATAKKVAGIRPDTKPVEDMTTDELTRMIDAVKRELQR